MAKKTPAKPSSSTPKKKPSTAASSPTPLPMIDTNQAAHSAAAFLAARVKPSQGGASAKQESVHFQKLKAGLGQSPLSANSPVGGSLKSGKPSKGPGFTQQVGHNQTFGANASRTGVPRRTSGG